MSNSVFLNQKLARTLTGRDPKSAAVHKQQQPGGSFMKAYTALNQQKDKRPAAGTPAPSSDDEDSRSRSLGKKPAQPPESCHTKKRKRQ